MTNPSLGILVNLSLLISLANGDDARAHAIVNLQAILNIDDMD